MSTEAYKTLILVTVGTLVCAGLHWLIGLGQRWAARRYTPPSSEGAPASPSLARLSFDWIGNALRTLVWFLFFAFLINVLPQARSQFEGAGERLSRLHETSLAWLIDRGVYVALVIGVTIFLMRFAAALIKTIFQLIERGAIETEEDTARRRLQTLSAIFRDAAQTVISFIGLMFLLQQLSVDVTPILASAGVVGLAVPFVI